MRKLISSVLALTLTIGIFGGAYGVGAASTTDGTVTQFEIIVPATARVNEAIDVTVRAVDKDKKVVTGYRGAIIFVPESFGDTVPMPGKSITFNTEDNGEKKFSKGVVFKSAGKQKVSVVDVIDDISGDATVNVESGEDTSSGANLEEVIIVSPSKDSKVTSDIVVVSGKSRKNSKLNVYLNGTDMGSVLSDESGVFSKSLSGITQAVNLLSVNLVDGAGKVVGKSEDISFEKISSGPAFYNLTLRPGLEVESSSNIAFVIEADPGLSEASIVMDSSSLRGREDAPGVYTIETVAPSNPGSYPISVNLTNNLGQNLNKTDVLSLTVLAKSSSFEAVKATAQGTKVNFTFGLLNPPSDLDKFKIAYGESADNFDQEAITWTKDKIIKADGTYAWYIDKLPAKTYSFKIIGLRADDTVIDNLTSEVMTASVGVTSTSCTIGNVGAIEVKTLADKSILSWQSVSGAVSYNLYKITPSGDSILFQNTKDTQYTVFLSSGAIVEEDFGVKALCDNNTESADFAKASKVRTGPAGVISIIVILSGILGAIIMRRRVL